LDRTQFSLSNTPGNNAVWRIARSRRGRAAFAKLTAGVLVELGLHNPLAAAIGQPGRSEWQLALGLLASLAKRALLLADRLHGSAAFASEAAVACERVESHFSHLCSHSDQSASPRTVPGWALLGQGLGTCQRPLARGQSLLAGGEFRARVGRKGHRSQMLALWTSLLDPRQAPADDLVRLYAERWEHELNTSISNMNCARRTCFTAARCPRPHRRSTL
jgi:hypothetical protein